MKSIPENEGLNSLILSQILTEDIYIIPEAKTVLPANQPKLEILEKKIDQEKPTDHLKASVKIEKKAPLTKNIIVVLDKSATDEEVEFLAKILGALKMTIQDVTIMEESEFSENISFKKFISFNVNPEKFNADIKTDKYIIKDYGNATFLYSDSLQELTKDVKKKKQLWEALQLMFLK